jgi:hypothetical protein
MAVKKVVTKFIGPLTEKGSKKKANKQAKKNHPGGPKTKKVLSSAVSGKTLASRQPIIVHGVLPGSIRIKRCEYLCELVPNGSAFVQNSFSFNPALSTTFPWLASIAAKFEKYVVHSVRLICSPRIGTGTAGGTYCAVDYDAADTVPTSKANLFQLGSYDDAQCWEHLELKFNVVKMNGSIGQHYTRTGPLAANLDIKTYDAAQFFVCTDASGSTYTDDVYLDYDIELIEPSDANSSPATFMVSTGATVVSTLLQNSGTISNPVATDPNIVYLANNADLFNIVSPGQWLVNITCKVNTSSGTTGILSVGAAVTSGAAPIITNANYIVCSNASSGATQAVFMVSTASANTNNPCQVYCTMEGSASSYGPLTITTTRLN